LFGNHLLPAFAAYPERRHPRPAPRTVAATPERPPAPAKPREPLVIETIHGARRAETKFQEATP
jgi:hypothetical protein